MRDLLAVRLFATGDVRVPIVDLGALASSIQVNESFLIGDLDVTLDIDHTWDSDLDVTLISPDGTRVLLFSGVGGSGNNFRNTTLDDAASTAVTLGTAPFPGAFRPAQSLAAFNGENARGTWTLEITDTVGGDDGLLNSWSLSVEPPADDFGDTFVTAQAISLSDQSTATQTGVIGEQGDQDLFRFEASHSGFMAVSQSGGAGPDLNSFLFAYDDSGTLLASNDDFRTVDSRVRFPVVQGRTYFLRADAFSTSVGSYVLSLVPDDHGDTFDQATAILLAPDGSATPVGALESAGDVDVFRFFAPLSGKLIVNQFLSDNNGLSGYLQAFDRNGQLLTVDSDTSNGDSLMRVQLTQGETYYVVAGSFGTGTATYMLTFNQVPDDHGDTFDQATAIFLAPDGSGISVGALESAEDVDVFRFVAPLSGKLIVNQQLSDNNGLSGYLQAYDRNGKLLAYDYDTSNVDSLVQVQLAQGETYYVLAGSFGIGTAACLLTFKLVADDHSENFPQATEVLFAPDGSATQAGMIESSGDLDLFRFVVPRTGTLVIRQHSSDGSGLSRFLYLYDRDGAPLTDDLDRLRVPVTQGETYFVLPAGFSSGTGAYTLTFEVVLDDYSDSFDTASPILLGADGSATQFAVFDSADDSDVFRFVAPFTGKLIIRQHISSGNERIGLLGVYDRNGDRVGALNLIDTDAVVRVSVKQGETYYVWAFGLDAGAYTLTFEAVLKDDHGDTFEEATDVTLGVGRLAVRRKGVIEAPGDLDMFRLVAPLSGTLLVRVQPRGRNNLFGLLTVYDRNGERLAEGNDVLRVNVVPGETYYIEVNTFGLEMGAYSVLFKVTGFLRAPVPVAVNSGSVRVAVDAPGDVDELVTAIEPSLPAIPAQVVRSGTLPLSSGASGGAGAGGVASGASDQGGDTVAGDRSDRLTVGTLADDKALASRDDLPSGVDLTAALLTGARPTAKLLPQKGTGLAPVGAVLPADDELPVTSPTADADLDWAPFVVGLDDTLHRLRRVPRVPAAANQGQANPNAQGVNLTNEPPPHLAANPRRQNFLVAEMLHTAFSIAATLVASGACCVRGARRLGRHSGRFLRNRRRPPT